VPGVPGVAAIDAAPESTTYAYRGDKAEQLLERNRNYMQEVVDGKHGEVSPAVKAEYQWQLSGAKGVLPAQVVNTPEMKKGAHDLEMQQYEAEVAQGVKHSPAKDAEYAAWHSRNHTDDEKAATARTVATAGAELQDANAEKRQNRQDLISSKQKFHETLTGAEKELRKDIERADRALMVLNKPGFAADAVAAPEFLQIVAGGMGSGLRMTDAELRRVNEAQTHFEQFAAEAAKWGFGDRKTIQDSLRKEMEAILKEVAAARHRHAEEVMSTRESIDKMGTVGELAKLHSDWFGKSVNSVAPEGAKPASKWSIQ
jgi:hypothetical protein